MFDDFLNVPKPKKWFFIRILEAAPVWVKFTKEIIGGTQP